MGLENFNTDDSSGDSSSSSTGPPKKDTSTDYPETDPMDETDMEFYGTGNADPGVNPMERKGAMSNYSKGEIINSIDSDIEIEEDQVKFYLPIFTIINSNPQYSQGEMYKLVHTKEKPKASWHSKPVSCIGVINTNLGSINKELAMFESGSPSKKRVMERFNDKLGEDISGETSIYISVFSDMFTLRDLAQANEEFRAGDLVEATQIEKKVLSPNQLKVSLERENSD